MAKRQKSLRDHYFAQSRETDIIEILSSGSENESTRETVASGVDRPPPTDVELACSLWKEHWSSQFQWLYFDANIGRVFCRVCKDKGGRSSYARDGSKNLKVSAFVDHGRSNEHKRLAWALNSGGKVMEKAILSGQRACDEAVACLLRAAYFLGKNSLPYAKFPPLCKLLLSVKAPITLSLYQDEKACAVLMKCISVVIQKKILNRIRNSPFFGVMVDESTDISVTGHLVVFATIIEEGLPVTLFLGLLPIEGGKKDANVIYETLLSKLRRWELNLRKFLGFGSDGASTMTGSATGVAARLKNQVNPYLLAVHCVAHRTNLAALDAAKSPACKVMSGEVDSLLNFVASFFISLPSGSMLSVLCRRSYLMPSAP